MIVFYLCLYTSMKHDELTGTLLPTEIFESERDASAPIRLLDLLDSSHKKRSIDGFNFGILGDVALSFGHVQVDCDWDVEVHIAHAELELSRRAIS